MRKLTVFTALALAMVCTAGATAQRQELKVGDKAPKLDVETWVKGGEQSISEGNVYVVEFWATWCGPCKRSIPHLTELQQLYGPEGLTIIGISDEEQEKVEPFVRRMGDRMNYTVAVDRRNGTKRQWFDAAKLKGIPAAFIVDRRGIIQWIGNPLEEDFGRVLSMVMSGRYDAKLYAETAQIRKAAENARNVHNYRMAFKYLNDLLEEDAYVFSWAALDMYEIKLLDQDDPQAAAAYAQEMLQRFASDPGTLAEFARYVATSPKVPDEKRDLDLALAASKAARQVAHPSDKAKALAVEALVHFHRGELEQAAQLQKEAYLTAMPSRKAQYRHTLQNYMKAHKQQVGSR